MSTPWDDSFAKAVEECLPEGVVADGLSPDDSLVELGLDSISMINLTARLEDEYGIGFPDELVDFETFATPARLWAAVCELRESADSAAT